MRQLRLWVRYLRKALETWQVLSQQYGWERSFYEKRPVDSQGGAIPWYTYPAIEFIRSLELENKRVFEFGCGNSSIFWAKVAHEVISVENDVEWARVVRDLKIPRLTIIEAPDRDQYISSLDRVGGKFDIIVIDGRFRQACVEPACHMVNPGGMIIFDNADWYPEACEEMRKDGWFQIDFSGFGPINPYCWTTAIFLRADISFNRSATVKPIGARYLTP